VKGAGRKRGVTKKTPAKRNHALLLDSGEKKGKKGGRGVCKIGYHQYTRRQKESPRGV